MNGRERIIAMLEGRPVDRLPLMPITMMFAADMTGAKYRNYATDYRVLVEAQIKTAAEFGLDYVSAISDPAREASDCGAKIEYFEDQPPALNETNALLSDKKMLATLHGPGLSGGPRMQDRLKAIELLRERAGSELLVEGWVEGPCAEGADLRGINNLMVDFFDDPAFVCDLFEFVVAMELDFARAQIEAGADIIGIGDAAASVAGPRVYDKYVWPYEKKLVDGIHQMGGRVRLHICGNTRRLLSGMGRLGCEMVDLDYPSPVSEGREKMGPSQVLAGNLNPVEEVMNARPDSVTASVARCHREAGSRYIVAAGCEIPRGTPHRNLKAMADYAGSHRPSDYQGREG